jgi:hypothetical protein
VRIHAIQTITDLCQYLDYHGWSTSVPNHDDSWEAHAWPELRRDGSMTADATRLHARLASLGHLGQMSTDSEGTPCAAILLRPPSVAHDRTHDRADMDAPA